MLSFLSTFSQPFMIAVLLWPFLALLLTLPILIGQYRKFNKIIIRRAFLIYLAMLYAIALATFTLYPMPSEPAAFCATYQLQPQLNPLEFIRDIKVDGITAMLQVLMNVVLFVPLGVFLRLLSKVRLVHVILIGFATSLLIEVSQLTGVFGLYPCSYRLFDVSDLMFNSLGSVIGYWVAATMPRATLAAARSDEGPLKNPGLLRMTVGFTIDQIVVYVIYVVLAVATLLAIGSEGARIISEPLSWTIVLAVHIVAPLLFRGWTIGSFMVRFNHDEIARTPVSRICFYAARALFLWLLVFLGNGIVTLATVMAVIIVWKRYKKLPYQLIR